MERASRLATHTHTNTHNKHTYSTYTNTHVSLAPKRNGVQVKQQDGLQVNTGLISPDVGRLQLLDEDDDDSDEEDKVDLR